MKRKRNYGSEDVPLPSAFVDFLQQNNISLDAYRAQLGEDIPRFIRVNPRSVVDVGQFYRSALFTNQTNVNAVVKESKDSNIENAHPQDITPLLYQCDLSDFYGVSPRLRLAQTSAYANGDVYGLDLSSGFAIHALDVQPWHHVLDLCAAPGAKLCMIADRMGRKGHIVAVDVSPARLRTCRSILNKYGVRMVDLVLADGTSFGRTHNQIFDRVLVDAECTHDGSLKHVMKFSSWGWDTFERRFLDRSRIEQLSILQQNLLQNGFDALKPGGTLVYSTCSFCERQNEDVVKWLLERNSSAELLPLDELLLLHSHQGRNRLPGTARLDPLHSKTSALFIARITRRSTPE